MYSYSWTRFLWGRLQILLFGAATRGYFWQLVRNNFHFFPGRYARFAGSTIVAGPHPRATQEPRSWGPVVLVATTWTRCARDGKLLEYRGCILRKAWGACLNNPSHVRLAAAWTRPSEASA